MGSWFIDKLINSLGFLLHWFIILCSFVHFNIVYLKQRFIVRAICNVISSLHFIRMLSLQSNTTTLLQYWFLRIIRQTEETLIRRITPYQLRRRYDIIYPYYITSNEDVFVSYCNFAPSYNHSVWALFYVRLRKLLKKCTER